MTTNNNSVPLSLLFVSLDELKEIEQQGDNQQVNQILLRITAMIKHETRRPIDIVALRC